ncbi:SRPBCC family protein [Tunturibacter empetritectus]|uniref:SRPBCC family protein n=1 Tax=Tunturiibacter empetritectus TaxID=3069691 RepID=A0A7W8IKW1_9BACT|nr:SRPBCC family protein [Edaphobacter lichenicola]MBB5319066.1 hypothetical protein [Edaphobacter lichenicola]
MIHIDEITTITAPIQRCFDLSRSVEVHFLANIHGGEQALAIAGLTSGLTNLSDQVTWRAKHFGTWQNLTNEVTAIEPPTYFQVTMVKGIFRSMQTDHIFRTLPSGATEMQDLLRISAPLPILGPLAEVLFLRNYMLSLVRERNAVIKQLAESSDWQSYLPTQSDTPTQTAPASTNKTAQRQTRP